MVARELRVPRRLTMDTTLLLFFSFYALACVLFLLTVYTPLVFFCSAVFPLCAILTMLPSHSQPHFPWMRIYLSLSRLEVGGASSLNMFCSRPPFFVCVTYYARHRGQFKKTPPLFVTTQGRTSIATMQRGKEIDQNPPRYSILLICTPKKRCVFLDPFLCSFLRQTHT